MWGSVVFWVQDIVVQSVVPCVGQVAIDVHGVGDFVCALEVQVLGGAVVWVFVLVASVVFWSVGDVLCCARGSAWLVCFGLACSWWLYWCVVQLVICSVMPTAAAVCHCWLQCCPPVVWVGVVLLSGRGNCCLSEAPKLMFGPGGKSGITVDCLHFVCELASG